MVHDGLMLLRERSVLISSCLLLPQQPRMNHLSLVVTPNQDAPRQLKGWWNQTLFFSFLLTFVYNVLAPFVFSRWTYLSAELISLMYPPGPRLSVTCRLTLNEPRFNDTSPCGKVTLLRCEEDSQLHETLAHSWSIQLSYSQFCGGCGGHVESSWLPKWMSCRRTSGDASLEFVW